MKQNFVSRIESLYPNTGKLKVMFHSRGVLLGIAVFLMRNKTTLNVAMGRR
jgi:hypothetical protein